MIGNYSAITDSNGFFNISVPVGMYDITISNPNVYFPGNTSMNITVFDTGKVWVIGWLGED